MTAPFELSVVDAAAAIRQGRLSAVDLVEACLGRIDACEEQVQAWVVVDRSGALEAARRLDVEAREARFRGPLHGVPVGLKDIIHAAGLETTAGARGFADTAPREDAPCVARLRAAGAVILGKLQTTEFAFSDPAVTRNPWHAARTPGGSSAGSAAAVAARMVPAALGSQTVGSVLRPAAFCGVVGLKPTYGRVSRRGVVPLAWSLDHVGVFARSVADAALVLSVLAGHDPADPGSATAPPPDVAAVVAAPPTRPPRLGLIGEPFLARATQEARAHLGEVARTLEARGAHVEPVRLPPLVAALYSAVITVSRAEAGRGSRGLPPAARGRLSPPHPRRRRARAVHPGRPLHPRPADPAAGPPGSGPAPRPVRRARHAVGPRAGSRPEHDRRRRLQRPLDRARGAHGVAADRPRGRRASARHPAHRGAFEESRLLAAARWAEAAIGFTAAPAALV